VIRNQVLITQHGEIVPINRVTIDRRGGRAVEVDEWIRNIVDKQETTITFSLDVNWRRDEK